MDPVSLRFSGFSVHRLCGYVSNIYIVEYPDKIMLLDSGSVGDVKEIVDFCVKELNRPMSDVKVCVVSHMHPDHAGGAVVMRHRFGIPLAAHFTVDKWYGGLTGMAQHQLDCIMEQYMGYAQGKGLRRVWFRRKLKPDYLLAEAQTVPGFEDWEVVHVPGHTLHDIAFYNRKEKLIHSGDVIVNVDGDLRLPIPVFFKETMRETFQKLSFLPIDTLLPGHGDIIQTPEAESLFLEMKKKVDEPLSDLRRAAQILSLLTPAVWKKIVGKLFFRG